MSVFQVQTKFRNEKRAKSGLLRGRKFRMKDMYSFHATEQELDAYYETAKQAYENVFRRCGLGDITYLTYASGGDFCRYSHEYQTIT
ncbi:MAG: aminoacyl--tRNA ligase-related protein, partial [Candidatus Thiodiazotropha sp.]